jgi:hypothetical protein
MPRKHRDDEVTQTIRVGREALDEAVRESEAAAKRIQSSVPPPEVEPESGDEGAEESCEQRERETKP